MIHLKRDKLILELGMYLLKVIHVTMKQQIMTYNI